MAEMKWAPSELELECFRLRAEIEHLRKENEELRDQVETLYQDLAGEDL